MPTKIRSYPNKVHPSATYRNYSVLYSNVRSVLNKRGALSSIFDDCAADVVVLTETWLTPNIASVELFDRENIIPFTDVIEKNRQEVVYL